MKPTTDLIKKDPIKRIKAINDLKASKALEDRRHNEAQIASITTQETILKAFKSLISYLDDPQRVTKASIVNQLQSVGTPDALKVADEVKSLHETIQNKNTDLSPVTDLLRDVLEQAKAIPKELATIDIPSSVEVNNLPDHSADFKDLLEAVKAIKLVAEAPKVNVEAPVVQVGDELKPMFKDLSKDIKALKTEQPEIINGAVQTQDISGLVTEKYNSFKIAYSKDDFEEDEEPKVSKITYFMGKAKVATLSFTYNSSGDLSGVARS